jgi:DNA mismatch repair protein MutS2
VVAVSLGQTTTGKIMEIQGKSAIVAFGMLKSSVKLTELEIISNNQIKKEQKKQTVAVDTVTDDLRQRKLHFKSDIDLRGFRADEALQAVTYFIDDAIMVGVGSVRILHGTGTGALRQLVRQYLGTVHGVKRFRDEHVQFGGAGITIVEFDN